MRSTKRRFARKGVGGIFFLFRECTKEACRKSIKRSVEWDRWISSRKSCLDWARLCSVNKQAKSVRSKRSFPGNPRSFIFHGGASAQENRQLHDRNQKVAPRPTYCSPLECVHRFARPRHGPLHTPRPRRFFDIEIDTGSEFSRYRVTGFLLSRSD